MSYNMSNPTHGTKVSTDPRSKTEIKHEYAGPVASDSLAAESLRAGGSFSRGNPADISSVSGANSTFAAHAQPGGPHCTEIRPGHKKGDSEVFETGRSGGVDDRIKTAATHTGTTGGGNQTREAFDGRTADGRDTTNIESVQNPPRRRGDVEQHQQSSGSGADENRPRVGLRGGAAPRESTGAAAGLNPNKFAPSSENRTGTVGDAETKKRETPDWSKIPNETRSTTNIGSEEDPGRLAEQKFQKTGLRQADVVGTNERGAKTGDKNPYEGLNADEST